MKQYKYLLAIIFFSLLSWSRTNAQTTLPTLICGSEEKAEKAIEKALNSMTLEEQIGQMIIPVIYPSLTSNDIEKAKRVISSCKAGGILYQKGEAYSQYVMNHQLQKSSKLPLLITADAEWGLAMRLKNTIRYPRNLALANVPSTKLIYQYGQSMASQCKEIGVHVNFAPVVDVNSNPRNPVIGTRSFGETKESVIPYAIAYSQGLEEGGVLSVAKHFPGHGDTSKDSHKTLPKVKRSRKQLEEVELAPFRDYFAKGLGGVMVAHLNVPALDRTGTASSLSKKITTDLLQKEMAFRGLIFTDGMQMQGMQQKGALPISVRAVLAGNDMLLGPTDPKQTYLEILSAVKEGIISPKDIRKHCAKILRYKWYLMGQNLAYTKENINTKNNFFARLNTEEARSLADKLWIQSIKFEENKDNLLPLQKSTKEQYALLELSYKNQYHSSFSSSLEDMGISLSKKAILGKKSSRKEMKQVLAQLSAYSTIFVHCDSSQPTTVWRNAIQELSKKHKVVLTLFTTPYSMKKWGRSIRSVSALVFAYESCDEAYRAVAFRYYHPSTQSYSIVRPPKGKLEQIIEEEPTKQLSQGFDTDIPKSGQWYELEKIVQEGLQEKAFPGCQITILHKGKVAYKKGFGTLDGTQNSPKVNNNTIYDLASITKAFATTPLVMQLVAQGKMRLSDRVDKFIPELRHTPVGQLRLRSLLLHQSGLTPSINFYVELLAKDSYPQGHFFSYRPINNGIRIGRNTWIHSGFRFNKNKVAKAKKGHFTIPFGNNLFIKDSFRKEMLELIGSTKLRSKNTYRYSDIGFILIGIMVERATGKTLAELAQERLYNPMGLTTFGYLPLKHLSHSQIAPTQKKCFLRGEFRGTVDDESAACLGGVSGNAGLFGTAEELAEVAQMILQKGKYNGKRIIPSSIVRQFISYRGVKNRRSLGFEIGRHNKSIPECAATGTFGHKGFTGCVVWIDPKNELIFVFLSNRTYPSRLNTKLNKLKIRYRLFEASYKALNI